MFENEDVFDNIKKELLAKVKKYYSFLNTLLVKLKNNDIDLNKFSDPIYFLFSTNYTRLVIEAENLIIDMFFVYDYYKSININIDIDKKHKHIFYKLKLFYDNLKSMELNSYNYNNKIKDNAISFLIYYFNSYFDIDKKVDRDLKKMIKKIKKSKKKYDRFSYQDSLLKDFFK